MGVIKIEQMEFYAFHGHYREEQIVGNRFLVDLEIETNMEKAAASDQLEDADNDQVAYKIVREEMKKKSKLLENIARRILDSLYKELPGMDKVTVTIKKMNPPMGGQIKSVNVSLSR